MINNVKLNCKPSDDLRTSNETTKTVDSSTGYQLNGISNLISPKNYQQKNLDKDFF